MNRILEFTPSQEEAVVARVLVLVHRAVDENFPAAEKAHRQFTKTLFSDDGEHTVAAPVPGGEHLDPGAAGTFASDNEITSPSNRPEPPAQQPPPPPAAAAPRRNAVSKAAKGSLSQKAAAAKARLDPAEPTSTKDHAVSAGDTPVTRSSSRLQPPASEDSGEKPAAASTDWITRITLGLLIAGLILLAYALRG